MFTCFNCWKQEDKVDLSDLFKPVHSFDQCTRLFIKSMVIPLIISSLDGYIIYVNEATCNLMKYTYDELLYKNINALVEPNMYDTHELRVGNNNVKLLQKNGTFINVNFSMSEIKNDELNFYIYTIIDSSYMICLNKVRKSIDK